MLQVTDDMVLECQRTLMGQISGQLYRDKVVMGLEDPISELKDFLEKIIFKHQSNSVLLYGCRGSGKTKALNIALGCLEREVESYNNSANTGQPRDAPPPILEPIVVHLNGKIHTNDRLALLGIGRQFQLNSKMEEHQNSLPRSFDVCLQWFIKLADVQVENASAEAGQTSGSESGEEGSSRHLKRPLIFILDEFDLFASHPKQTLLYNLFDMVHHAPRPVAIIGVTSRWDAVELLEKRIKSRFSNRQIQVFPAEALSIFSCLIHGHLTLPGEFKYPEFALLFNAAIESLMEDEQFISFYQKQYELHCNVRYFFNLITPSIYALSRDRPWLALSSILSSSTGQTKDHWVDIIAGLSLLEISLLIIIKKTMAVQELSVFNFELIYQEYKSHFGKNSLESLEKAPKNVALKAFESLVALEILQFLNSYAQSPVECRPSRLTIQPSQIIAAIRLVPDFPSIFNAWIS